MRSMRAYEHSNKKSGQSKSLRGLVLVVSGSIAMAR